MGSMTHAYDGMRVQVPCHDNVAISVPTNYFSINHFCEDERERTLLRIEKKTSFSYLEAASIFDPCSLFPFLCVFVFMDIGNGL